MLADLIRPGLRLVVCGTAAGTVSAVRREYYAGPGNKFWRTLADVGLTDRELLPANFKQLLNYGIGLTDLVKEQAGMDHTIRFIDADRLQLRTRIEQYQPRYLCFNGKRAAQQFLDTRQVAFGVQAERVGRTTIYVAPSTSGAANRSWDLSYWHELARLLRDGS